MTAQTPKTSKPPAGRALTETPAGGAPQPDRSYRANRGRAGAGRSEESATRAIRAENRPRAGCKPLESAGRTGRTGLEQESRRHAGRARHPGRTLARSAANSGRQPPRCDRHAAQHRPTTPTADHAAHGRPPGWPAQTEHVHGEHRRPRRTTVSFGRTGRNRDLLGPPYRPSAQFIFYSSEAVGVLGWAKGGTR